jgi:hypothetical protein
MPKIRPDRGAWRKAAAHWRDGDTAFISVAFTWQLPGARKIAEYYRAIGCKTVRAGGPGTFTRKKFLEDLCDVGGSIPDAITRHNPQATRASYGCPVGCWFCIVPKMDGKTFTLLPDFTPRPVLCDDNLSALPADYQRHIVARYQSAGVALLDANSGFEPATFDDEVFARWSPILKGPWRFGYDEKSEGANVERVFKMLRDVSPKRKQVYTMIGHEPFAVCMDRIRRVIAAGGEPYAQPFIKLNALRQRPEVRHDWTPQLLTDVKRWVNRHLWRKTPDFADYDRHVRSARAPAKMT